MTRLTKRRAGVIGGLVALSLSTFALFSAPAGAATKNPCKVLKKAEIQEVFGGTVSSGKKGLSTVVSSQCEFTVSAEGDRPEGTLTVKLMTTGAKAAYDGLKNDADFGYEPIDGVPNSLWGEKVHVVELLKGKVLVGVQGGFLITEPLPIHFYDDKEQLIELAQKAVKRA